MSSFYCPPQRSIPIVCVCVCVWLAGWLAGYLMLTVVALHCKIGGSFSSCQLLAWPLKLQVILFTRLAFKLVFDLPQKSWRWIAAPHQLYLDLCLFAILSGIYFCVRKFVYLCSSSVPIRYYLATAYFARNFIAPAIF